MKFTQTYLAGAYIVELERQVDERGYFARTFCEREFTELGLASRFPQCNISHNQRAGTLRGMHYDETPSHESKLVRCVSGAIFDVIVDLRRDSPTRWRWVGVELTPENGRALLVPPSFGHGFLSLVDDTDVFYHMGDFYRPSGARGFRYNDPFFSVQWPSPPSVLSDRDRTYPDFDPVGFDV